MGEAYIGYILAQRKYFKIQHFKGPQSSNNSNSFYKYMGGQLKICVALGCFVKIRKNPCIKRGITVKLCQKWP